MSDQRKPIYSYTQLSAFEQCQYSWDMIYNKHVPREGNFFSSYGSWIHLLLEQYAKGELTRASLGDLFEWEFDDRVPEKAPPNKYVDLHDSYKRQGIEFFNVFEGFDGMKILGIEEHFKLERPTYILQGYIDLIYEKDQQLICRDWKSAKAWSKKELADHAKQVYLYSAHCREKLGRFPDLLEFFHFREGNKKSVIQFNQKDYLATLEWADGVVLQINETWDYDHHYDDFFCNNLCSCRTSCEYREKERRKAFAARKQ